MYKEYLIPDQVVNHMTDTLTTQQDAVKTAMAFVPVSVSMPFYLASLGNEKVTSLALDKNGEGLLISWQQIDRRQMLTHIPLKQVRNITHRELQ